MICGLLVRARVVAWVGLLITGQLIGGHAPRAAGLAPIVAARTDDSVACPSVFANAGANRHASVGQIVQLDASRSLSLDGLALRYAWRLAQRPAGSRATLSSASALRPTFAVDVAGTYLFNLTVAEAGGNQFAQAQVTISTVETAPFARPGLNRVAAVGGTVAFDGSGSYDGDGDPISYSWTLAQRPYGSGAALSSASSPRPSLTLDQPGSYVATLVVKDSKGVVSAPVNAAVGTLDVFAPLPSAGPAQFVPLGAKVRIDADGTYQPGGDTTNASWSLIATPPGSRAALGVADDARQTFTVDVAGDYVVQVSIAGKPPSGDNVGCDDPAGGPSPAERLATVLVSTNPVPPVANAGPDQRIAQGAAATLDGAGSTDVSAEPLTYQWALISRPSGSVAALDDAAAVRPKFIADVAGTYVAQLIVADSLNPSPPATVVVSTTVAAPIVDAGDDVRGVSGAGAPLDGSQSNDPDGGVLTTRWSILGLGDQLTGSLSAPTAPTTEFLVPKAGVPLILALFTQGPTAIPLNQETDGQDNCDPVNLQLRSMGRATNAGIVYTIWRIRDATSHDKVATLTSGAYSVALAIPAQSDIYVASPIVAGLASHSLVVSGRIVATVDATSSTFDDTQLVGGGPPLELTIVQLVVDNALLQRADDVVVSTVEARPTAIAAKSLSGYRGAAVQLDGSQSLNPNRPAAPAAGLSYAWTLLWRPGGSSAALVDPTSAVASLTGDVYGLYVAQLIVSDGVLTSRPRTVAVTIAPRPPVALATAVSPLTTGALEPLDGSASYDPDGNPLVYAWTLTTKPAGSVAKLGNPSAAVASFTPDVAGDYAAQLLVSDAYGVSAPASVSIVADAGFAFAPLPAQTVALGSSIGFTVHVVSTGPAPAVYSVQASSLPPGATFDPATGAFAYEPLTGSATPYEIIFFATDGVHSATQTVALAVVGQASGTTAALTVQVYNAVDYSRGLLTPVAGAAVTVAGVSATTGANGSATLSQLPAGAETIVVSGAGAGSTPDGAAYGGAVSSVVLIAGVTNIPLSPILLGEIGAGAPINPGGATVVRDAAVNATLTIAPGSAFNADGTPYVGAVTLGTLPANTPASLPQGFSPCQLLTVSPVGVAFNPPAQLTVANLDGLPAGASADLWAFDLALGASRVVGVGQISADGATISMKTGGVPGGTVLAVAPRRPVLQQVATQPAGQFVPSLLGAGDLSARFSPPGSRQLDKRRGLSFIYHSSTANPRPFIDANALQGANTGLPNTLSTSLVVAGVSQSTVLTTNMSNPLRGGALSGAVNNSVRQATQLDAGALPTGQYAFSFLTLSKFSCSTVAGQVKGKVIVNNQAHSSIGAGWQLAEVQKLAIQPDGSALISEGTGRVVAMPAHQTPNFLPSPVYIPVNGPIRGAMADLTGTGLPSLARLGWKDGSINVILNGGNRIFAKTTSFAVSLPGVQNPDGSVTPDGSDVVFGDINGDGIADMALVASQESQVKVFYGASGGTFTQNAVTIESNVLGGNVLIGDWDGSGTTDLVMTEITAAGTEPDFHTIWNNPATGQLSFVPIGDVVGAKILSIASTRFPGLANDSIAAVIDNDTLAFLYTAPYGTNNYTADFLSLPAAPSQRSGRILASADIDGSGRPSFAVAGAQGVYIAQWMDRGAGNQSVTQTLTLPGGLSPDAVALAPTTVGGRPDLIVTANTAGFYVFLNDGRGHFGAPQLVQTPFRVGLQIDVADLDGDGFVDVALDDLDNDRVAIFFGQSHPDGTFVAPIGDYTSLKQNADGTYTRTYNDGTTVTFNGSGFQTVIADPNRNVTSYSYNGSGQLTGIVDPTGATTSFAYSGGVLASSTDGSGRTTTYEHDASGNLTTVTDPAGDTTQYLYDANHQLITTVDPNGNAVTRTFTATGQLSRTTFPDGASVLVDVSQALGLDALGVSLGGPSNAAFVPAGQRVSFLQDGNGNLSEQEVNAYGAVVRLTDSLGRNNLFVRDAANRLIVSTLAAGTSTGPGAPTASGLPTVVPSTTQATQYTYDGSGNLLTLHEGVGAPVFEQTLSVIDRTTNWQYEPVHNKVVQKTDGEGFVTTYAYDANGNVLAQTYANSGTVLAGYPATIGAAAAGTTAYAYNTQGLPVTRADPDGNVTNYAYDVNGNLTRTTDAAGTFFDRYYDAAGNLILTVDATGAALQRSRAYRFDADNRPVGETSATGQTTSQSYDSNGNVVQWVDAAGNVTSRVYDGLNRLVSETTPDAGTTLWSYDGNNSMLTVTDASGAVTTLSYDTVNRAISRVDPLGATQTQAYDLANNPIGFTDARGNTNNFSYDVLDRVQSRTNPLGATTYYGYDRRDNPGLIQTPGVVNHYLVFDEHSRVVADDVGGTFSYDPAGNLLAAHGLYNTAATFAYDALNRRVTAVVSGWSDLFEQAFSYDVLSRRASVADNFGAKTLYAFDLEDRLLSITTPWGAAIGQSYDQAGRPLQMTYPNGLDADLSFESQTGRLKTLSHQAGSLAAPVASFSHAYDVRGNLAALTELTGVKGFGYDPTQRLTGVTQTAPAPAVSVESYAYDPEGNRIPSQISPAYVTDADNRLLDDGINTYGYDVNGGLIWKIPKSGATSTTTYAQNFVGAIGGPELDLIGGPFDSRYIYDAFHRLAQIYWDFDPSRVRTDRFYDGDDMVLERRNPNGVAQWARYVHGQGVDQPLAMELYPVGAAPTPGTGTVYYYHPDGEGSIRLLTDATANVADRYDYDSFGQRVAVTQSVAQPYGWKGREWVDGPNLLYNRARWYDPAMGRFLSEDPLGYGGGQSNLYAFAANNPRNWNDPSGLQSAAGDLIATELAVTEEAAAAAGARAAALAATPNEQASDAGAALLPAAEEAVVGLKVACVFNVVADALGVANEGDIPIPTPSDCSAEPVQCFLPPPVRGIFDLLLDIGFSSFEAGTEIETQFGKRRIEDIRVGDLVVSRDAFTGKTTLRPVTRLYRRTTPGLVHLTLDSPSGHRETLGVTSEHPLFVEGRGWTEVRRLRLGDRILAGTGAPLAVAAADGVDAPTLVYNLEVAGDHSYFAGEGGAWAHNIIDWHHELPQAFRDFFQKRGLDIDSGEYGRLIDSCEHKAIHRRGYNSEWANWTENQPRATPKQVLKKLEEMRNKYGLNRFNQPLRRYRKS
ncbi:MAG: PKD domain-containing protein [Roseiarcus sp.]